MEEKLRFEDVATEYEMTFGKNPPVLDTISLDNQEYLKVLKDAIDNQKEIDYNYLGEIFMKNKKAFY